jgi:hypothetical protein
MMHLLGNRKKEKQDEIQIHILRPAGHDRDPAGADLQQPGHYPGDGIYNSFGVP